MINTPLLASSDEQLRSQLRQDLPLLILGSTIAAIGLAAIVVRLYRRQSHERLLLWFGLFAGPYGILVIAKTFTFQVAFGPQRFGLFVARFLDFVTIIPALLLFEYFYGKGWRGSVRWLIRAYVVFAVVAFATIVLRNRPDLIPSAGIGTALLLPLILVIGLVVGYRHPQVQDQGILWLGLISLFLAFAYDRIVSARSLEWRVEAEPYGVFVLICCLGYAATRRLLANERQLVALEEEMRAAKRIQASILPQIMPESKHLEIAVCYAPMTAVAGDFYDFVSLRPGCLGIVVADVTGHGVPAALVASMIKVAVSSRRNVGEEPSKVITGLNSTLSAQAQGQYASAVYVYLDAVQRIGRYAAAGHPPMLLWQPARRKLLELNETGLLLGVRPNEQYAQTEFSLEAGDRLLLYTDGVVEAMNADGELFGQARFAEFIKTHTSLTCHEFAEGLLQQVLAWPAHPTTQMQSDDITLVVIDMPPVT